MSDELMLIYRVRTRARFLQFWLNNGRITEDAWKDAQGESLELFVHLFFT